MRVIEYIESTMTLKNQCTTVQAPWIQRYKIIEFVKTKPFLNTSMRKPLQ